MILEVYNSNMRYPGVIMVPAQIGEFSENLRYILSER